jgi:hypothetical protein
MFDHDLQFFAAWTIVNPEGRAPGFESDPWFSDAWRLVQDGGAHGDMERR